MYLFFARRTINNIFSSPSIYIIYYSLNYSPASDSLVHCEYVHAKCRLVGKYLSAHFERQVKGIVLDCLSVLFVCCQNFRHLQRNGHVCEFSNFFQARTALIWKKIHQFPWIWATLIKIIFVADVIEK